MSLLVNEEQSQQSQTLKIKEEEEQKVVHQTYWWLVEKDLYESGLVRSYRLCGTDRETALGFIWNNVNLTSYQEVRDWLRESGTWERKGYYRAMYL